MELITDDDYASLPVDLIDRFVAFEAICRRNAKVALEPNVLTALSPSNGSMIQKEYMTLIAAAAAECGVEGLDYPGHLPVPELGFQNFLLKASGTTARFRLRGGAKLDANSVRLGSKTRGRIEQQIVKLREAINSSDLAEDERDRLLSKLDELSVELSQPRVRFGNVLAILALVGASLVGTSEFLASAPQAIATITSLIGADKLAEEAEVERLGPPPPPKSLPPMPRALPAPREPL